MHSVCAFWLLLFILKLCIIHASSSAVTNLPNTTLIIFSMTFRDQKLNSMTFQALKMKFLNSKTFQVFQDLYKPCTNSEWDENLKNCLPSLASCKAEVYQYKAVVQATTFFTHLLYLRKFLFCLSTAHLIFKTC